MSPSATIIIDLKIKTLITSLYSAAKEVAMDKFRQAVMKIAQISGPITGEDFIEERFNELFSKIQTPNHPPYAAMIETAILELKKKGGSNEESISDYIKLEYKDLPWAHSAILKHNLKELCDSGDLSMTSKGCYVLDVLEPKRGKAARRKRSKSKSHSARRRAKGRKKEESNEQEKNVVVEKKGLVEVNMVKEQNLAVVRVEEFDMTKQENSLMDLYPVTEPVMIQKKSEIELESEPDNMLIQGEENGGKCSLAEPESKLRALALPLLSYSHEKNDDEKLPDSEKAENSSEKAELTLSSEQIDYKGDSTDRWQRQLKRWIKSPPEVKLIKRRAKKKAAQDEEKNQKREPGIGVEDSCLAIVELPESELTSKESSLVLHEIMEDIQPKRQLRSQTRGQTLVKRENPLSPERSTKPKTTKLDKLPSCAKKQDSDSLKSQTKRLTQSKLTKFLEPISATPSQRSKLHSCNKQNESDSYALVTYSRDLALLQTEYNDSLHWVPKSSDTPANSHHQTPKTREQAPLRRSKRTPGKL